MSRDSIVWWFGMAGAAAAYIAAHFNRFPWIPEGYQGVVELIAFLAGVTSGKMAWSPLPLKGDS